MGVRLMKSSYIAQPQAFNQLLQAETLRLCFTNEGLSNKGNILESMDQ